MALNLPLLIRQCNERKELKLSLKLSEELSPIPVVTKNESTSGVKAMKATSQNDTETRGTILRALARNAAARY